MPSTATVDLPNSSAAEAIARDPFDFLADEERRSDQETDVSETSDDDSEEEGEKRDRPIEGEGFMAYRISTNPVTDDAYKLPIFGTLQEANEYAVEVVRTFKEFVFTHSDSAGQGFPHKERLLQPPYDSAMKEYYADLSQAVSSNSRHQAVYVRVLPTPMEEIHAIEEDEPRDPFSVGGTLWYKLLRESQWIDLD